MLPTRFFAPLFAALLAPTLSTAHESFLPLHHHSGSHGHARHEHAAHSHDEPDGKGGHIHKTPAFTEERFAIATGGRYTRYSLDEGDGHLWETGLGIDYAVTSWLHIGGDVSYGWYDSSAGRADGWMTPHAHLDYHIPLRGAWEVIVGLEVGFPGGDEALVGDHWEWAPHLEVRYDPGQWFAEIGATLAFIVGEEDHAHDHEGHAHEGEAHDHGDTADFHEIVDPHGERELDYYGTLGVRLLDRRLTLAGRLAGVHVLAGETPADDYLRAGLRVSYQITDKVLLTTEGSLPITDAERNQWQVSVGLRVGF